MFKNKLLKALLAPFMMLAVDDQGGGGAAAPEFDIAGSVESIADGLGFGEGESDEGNGNGDGAGGDDGAAAGAGDDGKGASEGDGKPEEASAKSAEGSAEDAAAAAASASSTGVAPRTWRPEAAAEWAKLPPVVQAEIAKREEDIFKGLEGYKAHASQGKAFQDVVAPYAATLQAAGADPIALTKEFMDAHMTFATGTQAQKQALLQQIIQGYGIQMPQAAPADGSAPFVDPQVKALQDQLLAVQSQIAQQTQTQQQAAARAQAEQHAKFAAEVDAFEADPKNIYFKDVAHLIPQVLQGGMAKNLQEAYDHAVMLHPATRDKEIARRTAETTAKAQAEAKAKADAAAAASAANVRTKSRTASGTAPVGSIDDTLKEAFAKITGAA